MDGNKATGEFQGSPAIKKMRTRILRTGTESTFKTYSQRLRQFLKWAELGPDEFVKGVESGAIYPPEKLNEFFDGRGDAPKSLKLFAASVKNLLRVNLSRKAKAGIDWDDLMLPKMRTVEVDRTPTRDVVKRTLAESRGIKDRVVPLIALSSGMRIGSIALLAVGEVDLEEFPDVGVVRVKPDISKGKVGYTTFITPEAKSVLIEYLDRRRQSGEEIHGGSPLVATPEGGFYSDPASLSTRWGKMLDRAGLGERGGKRRVYHFHVLRKLFRTSLERAGVSKSFRERLLGHAGEYLDASYFAPAFEELLSNYRTAVGELTIEETGVSEERVSGLEGELGETKERLEEMTKAFESMKEITVGKLTRELEAAGVDTSKSSHELARDMGVLEELREEAKSIQKVIPEAELISHLDKGWKYIAQLNNGSGQIVIEKANGY